MALLQLGRGEVGVGPAAQGGVPVGVIALLGRCPRGQGSAAGGGTALLRGLERRRSHLGSGRCTVRLGFGNMW